MKLTLENVRGFAGTHSLNIRPLTLLIGENSSGKTTLLSTLFAALQSDFPTADGFNRAPFELGTFDTIATYRGGKYGRAPTFSIGWESQGKQQNFLKADFRSQLGIPKLTHVELRNRDISLVGDLETGEWLLEEMHGKTSSFTLEFERGRSFALGEITFQIFRQLQRQDSGTTEGLAQDAFDKVYRLISWYHENRPRVTALAPLRTRPHRTYDELIEEFKPEGDHVPLVLARILSGEGSPDKQVQLALNSFGSSSGLFDSLKVKRMGRHPSDPFQLRVKGAGPDANLVDVGYGVSQALPIIVDSILAPKGQIVLIQQPEVHLHPKAQAALGTFFSELVRDTDKRYVIETHSDFLVDRVRMAIASGKISSSDVNIAFLQRDGLDVTIHELQLDALGNIVDPPEKYREFFLEEETRLLFRG